MKALVGHRSHLPGLLVLLLCTALALASDGPEEKQWVSMNQSIRKKVPVIQHPVAIDSEDEQDTKRKYNEVYHPNNNFFVVQNIINGMRKDPVPVVIKNSFINLWPARTLWTRQNYLSSHPVRIMSITSSLYKRCITHLCGQVTDGETTSGCGQCKHVSAR